MTDPTKRNASAGTLANSQSRYDDTATIRTGRKPFQGKAGNARNPSQRPPRWTQPKGADAIAELDALFPTLRPMPAHRRRR